VTTSSVNLQSAQIPITMSAPSHSQGIRFDLLLLRLPRELRDPIYHYALETSSPIPMRGSHFQGTSSIFQKNPTLYSEALEAFYKINTFTLTLPLNPLHLSGAWGPYPQAKTHIRHLIVTADECFPTRCSYEDYEQKYQGARYRRRWAQFLDVPHLQSLTVNLQKAHEDNLCTLDFGPILYHLRTLRPNLMLTFNISFDTLLDDYWNDPVWNLNSRDRGPFQAYGSMFAPSPILGATNALGGVVLDLPLPGDAYEPMGFFDISGMIEPPTDEDESYVVQYLPSRKMPPARSLKQGLLDETPANRRMLGKHYVAREPALLRLQMQQHYEVYMKYEDKI